MYLQTLKVKLFLVSIVKGEIDSWPVLLGVESISPFVFCIVCWKGSAWDASHLKGDVTQAKRWMTVISAKNNRDFSICHSSRDSIGCQKF